MAKLTMKFGGTSVGSPEAIAQVVEILREHRSGGHELALIVSAMSGVTDMLLDSAAAAAAAAEDAYRAINNVLRAKHEDAVEALITDERARAAILAELETLLAAHIELCEAVRILGEMTPRITDAIVSFGERLSSRLIAAAMQDAGLPVKQVDSQHPHRHRQPIPERRPAMASDGRPHQEDPAARTGRRHHADHHRLHRRHARRHHHDAWARRQRLQRRDHRGLPGSR